MQLQLANQAKVHPIGRVSNLVVDIEGMKTYANFEVIEVVDGGGYYPALLGIGWASDSLVMINSKKCVMNFKDHDIKFIGPMDPSEGGRYVEPIKEEVVGGWDHAYKISEDYVHPIANRELGW